MAKNALILGIIIVLAVCTTASVLPRPEASSTTGVMPRPVTAYSTTVSQVADKDTYVDTFGSDATANFGGKDWIIFGMYLSNPAETYIHFNFTNKPANVISAVVSVDCYSVSQTFNFTASVVTDARGEFTTTWMNKPNHAQVIGTYLATSSGSYNIDVTNFTSGTDLSICLNASNYSQQGYIQAASREGAYSFEPAPTIAWTYYEPYTNPSAPQSLAATYDNAHQCVDLSWSAPANNGNASILYTMYIGVIYLGMKLSSHRRT